MKNIRELSPLGFAEVNEKAHSGNAEFRRRNLFRLTYRHVSRAEPTHEWRRIKTMDEAKKIAKAARLGKALAPFRSGRPQPADVRAAESD